MIQWSPYIRSPSSTATPLIRPVLAGTDIFQLYCNIVGNKLIVVCCPSCNSILTYSCLVTCQAHKYMSQGDGRMSYSIYIVQSLNYAILVIGI